MTIDDALSHAGDIEHTPMEIMDELVRILPGYLWIVDNYMGDTGLPEFDAPTPGQRARLIRCGVCEGTRVEETRRGRYAVRYTQNDGVVCPFCGQIVMVKHVTRGIKTLVDRLNAVFYRKSAIDSNAVVALAARCERHFGLADQCEPWTLEPIVDVRGLAVFDAQAHDSLRLQNRVVWQEGKDCWHRVGLMWKEVKSMATLTFGDGALFDFQKPEKVALGASFERAIRGTPFERAWDQAYWCGTDGIAALNMIARYPCVEYLTKLGLSDFIASKLEGNLPSRTVTWKGGSMAEVLGLSKARLGELKGKRIHITPRLCAVLQVVDRDRVRCSAEVAERVAAACRDERPDLKYKLRNMLEMFPRERRPKALKFIARNCDYRLGDILDLWRMLMEVGGSLAVGDEVFPADFRAAHDRLAARVKNVKNAKLSKTIADRVPALTKKYGFEFGGLILRPAESAAEVVREGEVLHHCVATYVSKYASGETVICVLRRAVDPDAPFRTVEISATTGKVVQDRGLHNDWGEFKIDDNYRAMLDLFWEAWRERMKVRKSA